MKPIATRSLHRVQACGRQRAICWHRLVKRHGYTDHEKYMPRLLAHIRNINRHIKYITSARVGVGLLLPYNYTCTYERV